MLIGASLSRDKIIERLVMLGGYLDYPRNAAGVQRAIAELSPEAFHAAVLDYQKFNGLEVDGEVGPQTTRSLEDHRFCSLPDVMFVSEELNRWPDSNIRWMLLGDWPANVIDMGTVGAAFEWAWKQWAAVCGIRPQRVQRQQEAHVLIECRAIDRAGGTLAWSELANGTMGVKQQRYDSLEAWVFSATPERYKIDLARVACHEIGHVLGIGHISAGNLLQPTYDLVIRTPQAGDIREAVARYGPPLPDAPPPTPPGGPGGEEFVITIRGKGDIAALEASGFRVTKLPKAG